MSTEKAIPNPNADAISDLLTLRPAARACGFGHNHFNNLCLKQAVPPPKKITTVRRGSGRELGDWLKGLIERGEDGIWREWDPEIEDFKRLPTQYKNPVPPDAA